MVVFSELLDEALVAYWKQIFYNVFEVDFNVSEVYFNVLEED